MSRGIAPGTMASIENGVRSETPGVVSDQTNALVIITSDMNPYYSRLISIWLVIFPRDKSGLIFLPVFPEVAGNKFDHGKKLAEVFTLDNNGSPGNLFFDTLHEQIEWDHYIVLDYEALKKIINALGGVFVNGRIQKGQQALKIFEAIDNNPTLLVINQSAAITTTCQTISTWDIPKIEKFFELIVSLSAMDPGLTHWLAELIPALREDQPLNCEFPTLMEIFE